MLLLLGVLLSNAPLFAEDAKAKLSDEEIDELFQEAFMLASFGFYDEAKQRCQRILEQKPDQPTVKKLLASIQAKRSGGDPGAELKRKLEAMIVPEVDFKKADPADAIESLRATSRKLSRDKAAVNFVWLVPAEEKLAPVTLHLEKVSMLDAIDYTARAAGLKYRVEPRAVVIFKPESDSTIVE